MKKAGFRVVWMLLSFTVASTVAVCAVSRLSPVSLKRYES